MIEVEKKFPVEDLEKLRQQLSEMAPDVAWVTLSQSDEYFNHRQLAFDKQDIALRIRVVADRHILTYKGPNQDANTKIRDEVEVDLSAEDAEKVVQIFQGIGMHSVAKVNKQRENLTVRWEATNGEAASVTVSLDTVAEVGNFVELEQVVSTRDEVPQSVATLESLASHLGLSNPTTTSYLEMLLDSTA